MFVDEAAFTGETYPVEKLAGILPIDTPLAKRSNSLFMGSHVISVSANGHSAFVLTDDFSETSNLNGTVEFDTPSGGQISVLGIRYPTTGLYTEIPVVVP